MNQQTMDLTVVIEVLPPDFGLVDRAVFSVQDLGTAVVLAIPQGLCNVPDKELDALPAQVWKIPFWGSLAAWRNHVLGQLQTEWVLWFYSVEEFVRLDREILSRFIRESNGWQAAELEVDDPLDALRLFLRRPEIRYAGILAPQLRGILTEFGFKVEKLGVRVTSSSWTGSEELKDYIISEMERQISEYPGNIQAHWCLAMAYYSKRNLRDMKKTLKKMANSLMAGEKQALLSAWHLRVQDYPATLKEALEGLKTAPGHPELSFLAGMASFYLKQYPEAVGHFSRSLNRGPVESLYLDPGIGSSLSLLWLAQAEIYSGDAFSGIKRLLGLLEAYPYYRAAWQAVLAVLIRHPPEDVMELLSLAVTPAIVRQYFENLSKPTQEEELIKKWLIRNP